MTNIDLSKLTADQLDQISKQAKAEAKIKRKQEADELHKSVGKFIMKNIDKILTSGLDNDLKSELSKIAGKTIPGKEKPISGDVNPPQAQP